MLAEVWCAECGLPSAVILWESDFGTAVRHGEYCNDHGRAVLARLDGHPHSPAVQYWLGWVDCPKCQGDGTDEGRRCDICEGSM